MDKIYLDDKGEYRIDIPLNVYQSLKYCLSARLDKLPLKDKDSWEILYNQISDNYIAAVKELNNTGE